MRSRLSVLFSLLLIVAASAIIHVDSSLQLAPLPFRPAQRRAARAPDARIIEAYGRLPLSFEANRGQGDGAVKFLSRGAGYNLFLTSTEAVLSLKKPGVRKNSQIGGHPDTGGIPPIPPISLIAIQSASSAKSAADGVLRMKLVGSNPAAQISGAGELPGKTNYFIGNDPSKWRTNVPTYAKVKYADVYPGIDLVYYSNQQQLEYDFVVAPGANPNAIRLAFPSLGSHGKSSVPWARSAPVPNSMHPSVISVPSVVNSQAPSAPSAKSADERFALGSNDAASPIRIDAQGDLVLEAEGTELRLRKPLVYQEVNGARREVPGSYVLESRNDTAIVGFHLAAYDKTKPLTIDPEIIYSIFAGLYPAEVNAIAVDASGNAYLAGKSSSLVYPGNPPMNLVGQGGASVIKLNADATAVVYSAYFGGSNDNTATGIGVDATGSAYITGWTTSIDFPVVNAIQEKPGSGLCDQGRGNSNGPPLDYAMWQCLRHPPGCLREERGLLLLPRGNQPGPWERDRRRRERQRLCGGNDQLTGFSGS